MTETVAMIMQREILTLDPAMPIRQAAGLLQSAGQESAPVVDESGALIGILTQKDCFRPALHASYYQQWRGTVADQMSRTVKTIAASAGIVAAAEIFLEEPHRTLPVTEGTSVVGLLRREDVLGRLLDLG